MIFRRLLFQVLTFSLSGLSCASALALDEVEPNDDISSANDASRTSVIRGVIEPGANARYDHFRISPFVTNTTSTRKSAFSPALKRGPRISVSGFNPYHLPTIQIFRRIRIPLGAGTAVA